MIKDQVAHSQVPAGYNLYSLTIRETPGLYESMVSKEQEKSKSSRLLYVTPEKNWM